MMKKIWFLIVLMLVGLVACTNESELPNEEDLLRLTLEELAFFDGLEGRKAYIAVNGNIYDVSNSLLWPNGNHNGYQAGQDLTHPIMNLSPHGLSTLNGVPLIGILIEAADETPEPTPEENNEETQPLQLTLEQLSYYDGREGRPAYIAVNGQIYDVSNSPLWPNGSHNGYQAGQDLTHPIMNISPHGISTLSGIPIIGVLIESSDDPLSATTQLLQLTLEQLSYYDGREGRPAYVAVNGDIYDVTNSPLWPNGSHNDHHAGQDLTAELTMLSSHGLETLENMPIIGTLIESSQDEDR
jgi:predicted heme/steroid binding protein